MVSQCLLAGGGRPPPGHLTFWIFWISCLAPPRRQWRHPQQRRGARKSSPLTQEGPRTSAGVVTNSQSPAPRIVQTLVGGRSPAATDCQCDFFSPSRRPMRHAPLSRIGALRGRLAAQEPHNLGAGFLPVTQQKVTAGGIPYKAGAGNVLGGVARAPIGSVQVILGTD